MKWEKNLKKYYENNTLMKSYIYTALILKSLKNNLYEERGKRPQRELHKTNKDSIYLKDTKDTSEGKNWAIF